MNTEEIYIYNILPPEDQIRCVCVLRKHLTSRFLALLASSIVSIIEDGALGVDE